MTNESVDILMESYQFEEAAYLLRSLANEVRLRVITTLARVGEMSVTELQESTRCEQSLLSHHLIGMRARGVLSCRRSGKNRFYSIKDPRVVKVLKCVLKCGSDGQPLGGNEKLD
ncbi:MAG: metalloregulator ArsR/SmtB family transcription factor [Bacteroidota bacterium]|jgi:ArsR family transcriptional regulator|nr:metalloregulator ArsR/SmtB family transcription factor [Bacteroidota bacterium]HHU97852.1 helix-turn-helix transcriptional regulator [Petrimonas sp.]